jgi:hypothetical protein
MDVRILNLDGSLIDQSAVAAYEPTIHDLRFWGPRLRLSCRFGRFRAFERDLAKQLGAPTDAEPQATLYGSGDFHHVSLALLRRLTEPFNLLILDNHPDWMHSVPVMHCGTWVWHAAHLPLLHTIYHVGGEVDFDNAFRWLAPWSLLRSGKIRTFPAFRRLSRGAWSAVANDSIRQDRKTPTTAERVARLLETHGADLAARPLYISVDKDVMSADEAVVNWDSGFLNLDEVLLILKAFREAADGRLTGFDTTGDRSPVEVAGAFRWFLHVTEHPRLADEPTLSWRNAQVNAALLGSMPCKPRSGEPQRHNKTQTVV